MPGFLPSPKQDKEEESKKKKTIATVYGRKKPSFQRPPRDPIRKRNLNDVDDPAVAIPWMNQHHFFKVLEMKEKDPNTYKIMRQKMNEEWERFSTTDWKIYSNKEK